MKVALVGFRGAGKTSVFNALTGQTAQTGLGKKGAANLGRIEVPDERIDALSAIYRPKKTTYAEIQFVDVQGPADAEQRSGSGLDAELVTLIRDADALVHVVRAFENPMIDRAAEPARDIRAFEEELVLTDLLQVDKRIERLRKEKRGREIELLEELHAGLEEGTALRRRSFDDESRRAIASFGFASIKPVLLVVNQAEADIGKPPSADATDVAKKLGIDILALCAPMEADILAMAPEDQKAFLDDLGLVSPARARFIRAAYGLLDLISFLTSGEDEVRAWTIRRGTVAKAAAGKIHSDLEKGFIRAEVTAYADFAAFGSEAKVKEHGKLRVEGKDYVVQDGDIMHVRHSS